MPFVRSFVRSFVAKFVRCKVRSSIPEFQHSFVRSFQKSSFRSFVRSFASSLQSSGVTSADSKALTTFRWVFVRLLVRSDGRSLVSWRMRWSTRSFFNISHGLLTQSKRRSFVRSCIRSFMHSFHVARRVQLCNAPSAFRHPKPRRC